MTLSSSATWMSIALGLSLFGLGGHAQAQPAPRFKAVAFDYFVIFDANSVVPEVEKAFPGKGAEFDENLAHQTVRILLSAHHHRPLCRFLRRH